MTDHEELNVDDVLAVEDFSPIQVAQMAGVRNQLVYNYLKAGRIKGFKNRDGKWRIEASVAHDWVNAFTSNKLDRETKKAAQIAAELAGVINILETEMK